MSSGAWIFIIRFFLICSSWKVHLFALKRSECNRQKWKGINKKLQQNYCWNFSRFLNLIKDRKISHSTKDLSLVQGLYAFQLSTYMQNPKT